MIGGLDPALLALLVAGAALAGLVQGIAGFAFGMVSTSVWVWGLPPQLVAVMAVWGSLVGQVIGFFTVRRAWNLRALAPFLAGLVVGLPIGVWLLPQLDPLGFKLFLGALLVLGCPLLLWQQRLPPVALPHTLDRVGDGIAGTVGGVLGGLGGFSGIAPTLWCTLRRYDKDHQRGVIQNFLLVAHTSTMAGYALTGTITAPMLPLLPIVVAAMVVPSWLGARLYAGLSDVAFRRVVLVLLFTSGLLLLGTTLPKVLA